MRNTLENYFVTGLIICLFYLTTVTTATPLTLYVTDTTSDHHDNRLAYI